jgi:hypothetical protein
MMSVLNQICNRLIGKVLQDPLQTLKMEQDLTLLPMLSGVDGLNVLSLMCVSLTPMPSQTDIPVATESMSRKRNVNMSSE